MPTPIKVMSWNLNTFGVNTSFADLSWIADIIIYITPDIVCIQEIQSGVTPGPRIGTPIDITIQNTLTDLQNILNAKTHLGLWQFCVTGLNQGKRLDDNKSMRDAYAFFYNTNPSGGLGHAGRFDAIAMRIATHVHGNPRIIRDLPPGRKPGIVEFQLTKAGVVSDFNIVSFHAATPVNTIVSEKSVRYLARSADIGGMFIMAPANIATPSPVTNTLVVGDFNNNVGINQAYTGLQMIVVASGVRGYRMGIGTVGGPILTTYNRTIPTAPLWTATRVSSYDNIFSFQPQILPWTPGIAFDFISHYIQPLAALLTPAIAFHTLYKTYMKPVGVSDHLPVIQTLQIN